MKLVAIALGLTSLAMAAVYVLVPAGSLPGFLPGFEAGSDRIHITHGLAALAAAMVVFGFAWYREGGVTERAAAGRRGTGFMGRPLGLSPCCHIRSAGTFATPN